MTQKNFAERLKAAMAILLEPGGTDGTPEQKGVVAQRPPACERQPLVREHLVDPVSEPAEERNFPAETYESGLAFGVGVKIDNGWEWVGELPGTLNVPACDARRFWLSSLDVELKDKDLPDYKEELEELDIQELAFFGVSNEDLKKYKKSGILEEATSLWFCTAKRLTDLSPLLDLKNLSHLVITRCEEEIDFAVIEQLENLQTLGLEDCLRVKKVPPSLAKLEKLESLLLQECVNLVDISAVEEMTNLQEINLNECPRVESLAPLAKLSQLKKVFIGKCGVLDDLEPLLALTDLEALFLTTGQYDASFLMEFKKLRHIRFQNCMNLVKFYPLKDLLELSKLEFVGCPKIRNIDIRDFRRIKPLCLVKKSD